MITQFITYAEKRNLNIKKHPSDTKFLIIENCTLKEGAELCRKFKASGSLCGKNGEHFIIGNFGKYY
jgi:hypothetical protein